MRRRRGSRLRAICLVARLSCRRVFYSIPSFQGWKGNYPPSDSSETALAAGRPASWFFNHEPREPHEHFFRLGVLTRPFSILLPLSEIQNPAKPIRFELFVWFVVENIANYEGSSLQIT